MRHVIGTYPSMPHTTTNTAPRHGSTNCHPQPPRAHIMMPWCSRHAGAITSCCGLLLAPLRLTSRCACARAYIVGSWPHSSPHTSCLLLQSHGANLAPLLLPQTMPTAASSHDHCVQVTSMARGEATLKKWCQLTPFVSKEIVEIYH